MIDQKRFNFKFIVLALLCLFFTFLKLTLNTYCLNYRIVEIPNEIIINDYDIEAETEEEVNSIINNIIINNNLDTNNYKIIIDNFNIRIVKAENNLTEETETEEENLIETPKGGIMLLIDYIANKKYTTTDGEEIYLNDEIINNGYKYLYIYKSTSASGYHYYFFNEYEITGYSSAGNPNKILFRECIKVINGSGTTITNILKEGANLSCTIYEEKEISIFGASILNFNLYKNDETIYKEANINITPEIEEPEPEIPEEPEEPEENNSNYENLIKEANSNLKEIKNILISINILLAIIFLYSFARRMFR